MASTSQKPLPNIPQRQEAGRSLTNLTVEGRDHLRRIILNALDDGTDFSGEVRDSLAGSMESALDVLGENISKGGWLVGVKRSRMARKARRAEQRKKPEEKKAKESEDAPHLKGESKGDPSKSLPKPEEKDLPGYPSETSSQAASAPRTPPKQSAGLGLALEQLRELAARPSVPTPKPPAKHLLLCLSLFGKDLPGEDSGFSIVPGNKDCIFKPEIFSLPQELVDESESGILFGLNEWDVNTLSSDDTNIRVVGGTFLLKGAASQEEHDALTKALRIAIYVHLSLLLEQHFLSDSNVSLKFSKPRLIKTASPIRPAPFPTQPPSPILQQPQPRNGFLSSGIMSFFSRKTEGLVHRLNSPLFPRAASLDIQRTPPTSGMGMLSSRPSEDNALGRLRRLSFLHDQRAGSLSQMTKPETPTVPDKPFATVLKQLEKNKSLLSSSPGIYIPPPAILVTLAAREKLDPSRKLRGDEKTGLKTIRGWEGRKSQGRGLIGTLGFVRQQEFSVLHSRHVPSLLPLPPVQTTPDSSSIPNELPYRTPLPETIYTPCDKPRWITYKYYSRDPSLDKTLGDAIVDLCASADSNCDKPGCTFKRGEHEIRFTHGGMRITLRVEPREITGETSGSQNDSIELWESCKVCAKESRRRMMSDGAYLFSFAKFLELLCYSPAIYQLTPEICEHTCPPAPAPGSPSHLNSDPTNITQLKWRLDILRHFAYQSHTVSVKLSAVEDIFELRVPKLQIVRTGGSLDGGSEKPTESHSKPGEDGKADDEKKALRREIKEWWQGVAEHMDKLEANLNQDRAESFSKSLPRLPSVDDAYEDLDTPTTETPKAKILDLPVLPSSTPTTPPLSVGSIERAEPLLGSEMPTPMVEAPPPTPSKESELTFKSSSESTSTLSTSPPPIPTKDNQTGESIHKLQSLRHSFQRIEQSLHASLSRTPTSSLNDVRHAFLSAGRGASRRLSAWQKKHLAQTTKGQLVVGNLSVKEPEWWNKNCHAIPGGNIIVREDDWGSIIAFTLASREYQRELSGMSLGRSASTAPSVPSPAPTTATNQSSFFGSNVAYKLFSSSAKPDPDQEGLVWHEPEAFSAVVSRKEHPRDHNSLLSIREVLRRQPSGEGFSGLPSRFGSADGSKSRNVSGITPPSAWAKPAAEVSTYVAGGEVSSTSQSESAGKILQEMGSSVAPVPSVPSSESSHASSVSDTEASKSQFGDAHIRRGKAASLLSDATIGPTKEDNVDPPALPAKDNELQSAVSPTHSSFATSLTHAMRYIMSNDAPSRSVSPSFIKQHSLLYADAFSIDERPHIKYDWMIGKRLKFSCTAYYAKQFDTLRRRCGIEDIFLKSLGRSTNWAAEGGKSRSNFWKTTDDRFVIKTLVNAWNVADLSVLIDIAPAYFRYMETTSGEPTVLAKLLGFYTVEIKNLESGNTQAKADLLLMENLFFDQKIGKTFDLKGIQGRKVKPGSSNNDSVNKTLFDGEWIEGQQRTLMLVPPHSKLILREAVQNDSDFLAKSNIMDYSLLLGVDEERKQIACGLVDTIGSYTFAKTLEYKAKQGLKGGNDVTVIPPAEYQERFIKALDGYFMACPDKWSRPLDSTKIINDPKFLPSVF